MRIRIRSDLLIFGPPDPVLFSLDPDPTCNNGFIKLFSSEQNINQNLLKMIVYKIEFYAYLPKILI